MPRTTRLCCLLAACAFIAAAPAVAHADDAATTAKDVSVNEALAAVLAAQPPDIKERYAARHPAETLAFFEVMTGDVVIETLPGGGWYSGILHPFLGEKGRLIGAHYPLAVLERFGWDKERLQSALDRNANWPKTTLANAVVKGGAIDSFDITQMPESINGTADKILFIRSLHNLSRFNKDGGFLDKAIAEAFRALKPGGIAGVEQHRAPETASDTWAEGSNGYLKPSKVIAVFEKAGFKLVATSEINANPKDKPTDKDNVWRLPPSLRGLEANSDAWRANKEIGESDRITLKFVKPAS
ncbi:MAG: hypothetical protein ABL907_17650 [Hyphomicrobium sp.]